MENKGTNDQLNELIVQSGLQKERTQVIADQLSSFFAKASEWNEKIDTIVITDPTQKPEMKIARETRLMLRTYRLDATRLIKDNRDLLKQKMADEILMDKLYLNAGKMITAVFENLETKLETKEKFGERWETEQKLILRTERLCELSVFSENVEMYPVENMSIEQFNELKNGLKLAKENAIAKQLADDQERERLQAEQMVAIELKRRQSSLLTNGFNWDGSNFVFETVTLSPIEIKEMTTEKFDNAMIEAVEIINSIKAQQQQTIIDQQKEIEKLKSQQTEYSISDGFGVSLIPSTPTPEPIKPKIEIAPNPTNANPNPVVQKMEWFEWLKKQKLTETPFGHFELDDAIQKNFKIFTDWALATIQQTKF